MIQCRNYCTVPPRSDTTHYSRVDGLKTGYTSEAGFCITATAKINDMRIITVVMGEPDTKTRNSDVASVFDYVYAQYALNKVVKQGDVVGKLKLSNGTTIDLTVKEDVKKANIIEYFYKYLKRVIN